MHRRVFVGVVATLVAVLGPLPLESLQSPPKRVVFLSILPPNAPKDARPSLITTMEDSPATIGIPELGQFGFTPSFRTGDDKIVVVTISDASAKPSRDLGKVDVPVAGAAVQSKTNPSFSIQVTRVTQPK